ncbi:FMN-dependent NADH-azoreductase [Paracoccus sp. M683]|uniref:FMN-dependent NADH-azoreductase n=1 Tax=Paracoccus sp. M683 TaxID=2594268 RepID=UPI0011811A8E|nr:NAD(P)H-dependent oxidoreductase [Paracoccus sp. M683]TRW97563.1 FMN-dependent NADH-azoreductase [Paracoccus sp. M683]
MNILHLDSAITGETSVSRKLTGDIVAKLKANHPSASVTYRDLALGVPAIDGTWVEATRGAAGDGSAAHTAAVATSDTYLKEVQDADVLVIGMPIYNFSIGAPLKSWIDQIARAGISFRYTEAGPEGLLKGKRAIVAYSASGTPMGSDLDHASDYLRFILGFFGITDVEFIAADNLVFDRDASLARANAELEKLAA